MAFCTEKCKEAGMKQFHSVECAILRFFHSYDELETKSLQLTLRMLVTLGNEFFVKCYISEAFATEKLTSAEFAG